MIPSEFQYFSPATVDEAVALLQQHGDDAKIIAGGHSLLPAMKLRLAQPTVLVDISKIAGLKGIAVNGNVKIGAGSDECGDRRAVAVRRQAHADAGVSGAGVASNQRKMKLQIANCKLQISSS